MMRKLIAAVLTFAFIMGLSACSIDKKVVNEKENVSTTVKVTKIYNSFKDVLPDFDFDREPVEKYEEGVRYVISVISSKREFESYVKKIKKAGFEERAVEAEGYYCAYDSDGFYVEITLVNDMLTVNIKRT